MVSHIHHNIELHTTKMADPDPETTSNPALRPLKSLMICLPPRAVLALSQCPPPRPCVGPGRFHLRATGKFLKTAPVMISLSEAASSAQLGTLDVK